MINFGIIGTGWITESWIAAAHATKQWRLVAVYSRSEDTAKAFAQKHNASKTHTTLDSLAADPDIQAVYIASPNSLHFEQALQMLSAKKHVIAEKPAASNERELTQLFAAAKQHGVFLIEAFRHLHEANFRALQRSLPRLGPIYGASLTYASYSSRYDRVLAGDTPNIFSLAFSAGALADLAVYPLSAAVALFGAPLSATYKPFVIATGADGGGVILLRYERFGVAVNASKIYTSTAPSEVYGEKGTLVTNAITDLEYVRFLDPHKKGVPPEELGTEKKELNMMEEAEHYAQILLKGDAEEAAKLERLSLEVVKLTEGLRKENGLVFGCEKES
jgi:predicted dehydrogenase